MSAKLLLPLLGIKILDSEEDMMTYTVYSQEIQQE